MSRLIWPLLLALILTGCSAFQDKDETIGWSQQKLFTEATDDMRGGNYERAIKYYEILESRYPFGKYAHQSQLNVAYAYYRYAEPESALAAADRFIKLHPGHPATGGGDAHHLAVAVHRDAQLLHEPPEGPGDLVHPLRAARLPPVARPIHHPVAARGGHRAVLAGDENASI